MAPAFDWNAHVAPSARVVPEHILNGILEAAGLSVAGGRLARTAEEVRAAIAEVGVPAAVKGVSATLTHRAAAGLLRLDVETEDGVLEADAAFRSKAAALGADYEGTWVQRMVPGGFELVVTALRDPDMGPMVGCGIGGTLTEIVDDVALARAPVDANGAVNLLACLRTLRARPELLNAEQTRLAAEFIAAFSELAASAPWPRFNLEVNPLKVGPDFATAVDGLLVIQPPE